MFKVKKSFPSKGGLGWLCLTALLCTFLGGLYSLLVLLLMILKHRGLYDHLKVGVIITIP